MWTDDAGNLVGYIGADGPPENSDHRHRSTAGPGAATRVMAHMDELSMLVKRIEPDGSSSTSWCSPTATATRTPRRSDVPGRRIRLPASWQRCPVSRGDEVQDTLRLLPDVDPKDENRPTKASRAMVCASLKLLVRFLA